MVRQEEARVILQVPPGNGAVRWRVTLTQEDGGQREAEGTGETGADGRLPVTLPAVALGYHRVVAEAQRDGVRREATQSFIVAPAGCPRPAELLQSERAFGITTNLYTLRSDRNPGFGNLSDLAQLSTWAADCGAAFVGCNPLHLLRNREPDVSPYRPVSRLYRNPLYLDLERIPEMSSCLESRRRWTALQPALLELREGGRIAYGRLRTELEPLLRSLHATFARIHRDRGTDRGQAYDDYRRREGDLLDRLGIFLALQEDLGDAPWPGWPSSLRDPSSEPVSMFRDAHPEEIDFHRWTQFELDRQHAQAARHGRKAGLRLGLYHDLAVGTAGDGFDPWAFPGLFVAQASIGAPPDAYSAEGQDWALPPVDPRGLRADRFRYWVRSVRAALAHAGILRIDHVMGLLRQFWIPAGLSGAEGAYVSYPAEELLGIVALESRRAGALVVGEDLGTVPEGFDALLDRWNVLSTRVLPFERHSDGTFRPPAEYPRRAMVAAGTHDMPPLPALLADEDLCMRRRAGQIADDGALEDAREQRALDRAALLELLRQEKILAPAARPAAAELVTAVHDLLRRTPAALLAASLDDLAGEIEPVNLPGVGQDRHASWTRRMTATLEELTRSDRVRECLRPLAAAAKHAVKEPA